VPPTPSARRLAAALSSAALGLLAAAPAALAEPAYHGVNAHSLWGGAPSTTIQRELDLSSQAHANVVRLDVGWSSLETNGKGQFSQWYVQALDAFVAGADARGMKVIATLMNTPCWASSAPETLKQGCAGAWWDRDVAKYPPTNPQDYADAARWMTARYGTKLAALEVWNEPNPSQDFWRSSDPAGDYVRLVKAAYPAAKAGNAQVPVLAGALADADKPFLDQLYADGIKGSYDGISIHPYNGWRDPADMAPGTPTIYTFVPGTQAIHDTQVAHGDSTPLWLTEFGWATCTTGERICVSRDQQATYLAKSVQILRTDLPYVRGYTIYELRDEGTSGSRSDSYGIVNHDFSPKPSFAALASAFAGSAPAPDAGSGSGTGTGTISQPPPPTGKKPRRVRLRLARRGHFVYATGHAPTGSKVVITARKCRRHCRRLRLAGHRKLVLRIGTDGRFFRRIGKAGRLRRARVKARIAGTHAVVAARVR
jgi:hypothetical protein